ncbi:PstS family phosphate ABC transporter substrate-binding protein [Aetokthonos hydrillicola Thurmond2011]|jgi:phosphate transport system substrate-binding protein|uniref:PstS family phosphate ABC transporter substrate-binding protein n=1 Tax=Aetokthonos hydrillicola Thurmond2011 TaxID=2712845 RepID=A0AAP5MA82_9CYAN|nr:PstS family phosphate ABC transporter substrate-binding protein [Aetokthonos hydrillicola]MBW4583742.1 PstS family phosphate ABC transporter substrate-binding protein [Aetokthonos hydrillicola CCALA 1050]MDR9895563.1 PstS family phosphate ABC transporter substrate-binding protein [Aetokthonos hydrillicola Thurmond2011]
MSQKNETAVLVLALLTTLGLVGGIFWWLAQGSDFRINSDNSPSHQLEFSNKSNFASVSSKVPPGLFSYGGSTTWAPIRKVVDPVIQNDVPQFRLRYTDPTFGAPGSGSGIKMLLNNQLAFSQSSRSVQPEEHQQAQRQNFTLKEIPVAIDGIAIAVNPELNISGLTIAQIKDIYTSKITNWQQVGGPNLPIVPYSRRKEEGGTVEFFVENILEKWQFGAGVKFISTTTQALRELGRNRGGIYYASATEVVGQCSVKPLPVGRTSAQVVPPYKLPFVPLSQCPEKRNQLNAAGFQSGEYPVTRRLFVIVKQNGQTDQDAGEAYANLLLTNQGQELITKAGFVRIR